MAEGEKTLDKRSRGICIKYSDDDLLTTTETLMWPDCRSVDDCTLNSLA